MAIFKTGAALATIGLVTDVHTSQQNPLGARVQDDLGDEFVYLQGIGSVAAGDWVMYGQLSATPYVVARMLNDANTGGAGLVALAMAAVLASQFGWFQIYGANAVANVATTGAPSAGAALYRSGTTARTAVSAVAKDGIFGAFLTGAAVTNVGPVFLCYPHVMDQSTL